MNTKLHEDFDIQAITEGTQITEGENVIRHVCMLGPTSRNKDRQGRPRQYSDKALKSAARIFEGAPCFDNHYTDDDKRKGRTRLLSTDLIGTWMNVRFEEDKRRVFGDLHHRSDMKPVMEILIKSPAIAKSSIHADGIVDDKTNTVLDITEGESVDLVRHGGTTNNLYEEGGKEVENMPEKEIKTIDELKEAYPELFEKYEEEVTEGIKVALSAKLKEEADKQKEPEKKETEVTESDETKELREKVEKLERDKTITEALMEHKVQKDQVPKSYMALLETCPTEQIAAVIADTAKLLERNRTYQTVGKDDLSPTPKKLTEEQERDFIAKLN